MSVDHSLDLPAEFAALLAASPTPAWSPQLAARAGALAARAAEAWAGQRLAPGAWVGPYRIEEVLGAGGQGTVYRALDEAGRVFALKVPRPELVSRLIREAQILFHLDHPRVVRIERAEVRGEVPYFATEFLGGGSLADRLALPPHRLDSAEALALADEVLQALTYAHDKGVLHRDLKPSNILFDEQGRAKVADFGIGSLALLAERGVEGTLVSHDRTGVVGTPLYMAPEQEHPEEPLDGRCDLYALGKLLYEALSGRSPRTLRPLAHDAPGLDPAWEAYLFRLVEDRPEDRFPDASAARAALLELTRLPGELARPRVGREASAPAVRAERSPTSAASPAEIPWGRLGHQPGLRWLAPAAGGVWLGAALGAALLSDHLLAPLALCLGLGLATSGLVLSRARVEVPVDGNHLGLAACLLIGLLASAGSVWLTIVRQPEVAWPQPLAAFGLAPLITLAAYLLLRRGGAPSRA